MRLQDEICPSIGLTNISDVYYTLLNLLNLMEYISPYKINNIAYPYFVSCLIIQMKKVSCWLNVLFLRVLH